MCTGPGAARCGASRRRRVLDRLGSPLPLPPLQPPGPQELPCSSEGGRENLLHQAMQNSGIVLERAPGEEGTLGPATPTVSSPQPPGDTAPELPLLEVEQVETVCPCPMVGSWGAGPGVPSHTLTQPLLAAWPSLAVGSSSPCAVTHPLTCLLPPRVGVPQCGPGPANGVQPPWVLEGCCGPPAGGWRGLVCAQDPPVPSVQ